MSATGDTEETRRISTEMTRQAPDYLPGWTLLAELAFKDKKYDEALSLLENVFSRDPEYVDGHRLESDVLLAKGDTKKAVEVLERLDQTYPDIAAHQIRIGTRISQEQQYESGKGGVGSGHLAQSELCRCHSAPRRHQSSLRSWRSGHRTDNSFTERDLPS